MAQQKEEVKDLQRGLSNRHIQLIALGGAIGTGLFLGIGPTVVMAGPSVLLGYAFTGIIAFLIVRQLGEMVVEEPVSGSFSHFANRYWHPFAGFAAGWNYWLMFVLVSMAELTAIGTYVQFWWPEIPLWVSSLFFFILVNIINLSNVRVYGEFEFLFSIVKVVAIIGMIVFGLYLLLSGSGGPQASFDNLWNDNGFFPKGWFNKTEEGGYQGLLAAMVIIMFSFGGLELIGITAAEAKDPDKTIPKATNQVIYRVLVFYVGSLLILFSLSPWRNITAGSSPFVMVFNNLKGLEVTLLGHTFYMTSVVANILNVVVLTAALSVYNSSLYCNSRMLFGLAKQGHAPKFLAKLSAHHVPVMAILVSGVFAGVCVVVNYHIPEKAFEILMALVVSTLIINWLMISCTHLFFRHKKNKAGIRTKFRVPFFPFTNYISLFFLCGLLILMWVIGMRMQVELIPIWLLVLFVGYKVYGVKKTKTNQ